MERESLWFLKNYLKTNPVGPKSKEAIEMIQNLQKLLENEMKGSQSPEKAESLSQKKASEPFLKPIEERQVDLSDIFNKNADKEKKLEYDLDKESAIKDSDSSSFSIMSDNKFDKILKVNTDDIVLQKISNLNDKKKSSDISSPQVKRSPTDEFYKSQRSLLPSSGKEKKLSILSAQEQQPIEQVDIRKDSFFPIDTKPTAISFSSSKMKEIERRIEEKKIPVDKPKTQPASQQPAKKIDWESSSYTIIFPPGKIAHPDLSVNIISEFLNIENSVARKRIYHGKGIILRNIDFKNARDILQNFKVSGEKIRAIREDAALIYSDSHEVLSCNFLENGLICKTENQEYVIPPKEALLLAGGSILISSKEGNKKDLIDLFIKNPNLRLRFWENTFNFKKSGISFNPTLENNLLFLIKKISAFAPHLIFCPNVKTVLKHTIKFPHTFYSLNEFENYGDWLILSQFGKDLGKKIKI